MAYNEKDINETNMRKLTDEQLDEVAGGAVECGPGMSYDITVGHCVEVKPGIKPGATPQVREY